jgi:hypothetical protein
MTPLRQQMIAALQLRGKGERTQQTSVRSIVPAGGSQTTVRPGDPHEPTALSPLCTRLQNP